MDVKKINFKAAFIVTAFPILTSQPLLAALDWPWQQAAEQKTKSTSSVPASQESAVVVIDPQSQTRRSIKPLQQNSLSLSKPDTMKVRDLMRKPAGASNGNMTEVMKEKNKITESAENSFTVVAPQRNGSYEEAVKMQAKLNDMLSVTANMDQLNRAKLGTVQSMVEKAKENQDLLKKLASPNDAIANVKKADAAQILLSKKLRGMREDAEKQIALSQASRGQRAPKVR